MSDDGHLRSIVCRLCETAWRKYPRLPREDAPVVLRAITATKVTDALARLERFERRDAKRSPPELCYIPLVALPSPPKEEPR